MTPTDFALLTEFSTIRQDIETGRIRLQRFTYLQLHSPDLQLVEEPAVWSDDDSVSVSAQA